MQNDKFEQVVRYIATTQSSQTSKQCSLQKFPIVLSPQGVRTGSRDYYKKKLENAYHVIHDLTDSPLPIEDVPKLVPYPKVTPKNT